MRKSGPNIMVFEVIFILFFGAFALIAFGPGSSPRLVRVIHENLQWEISV